MTGHTGMAPTIPVAKNHQTSQFEPVWPPPYWYGGGHTGSKISRYGPAGSASRLNGSSLLIKGQEHRFSPLIPVIDKVYSG